MTFFNNITYNVISTSHYSQLAIREHFSLERQGEMKRERMKVKAN